MQTCLSERMEAAIPTQVFTDDELENRVRSLLRWKIRFNAVAVAVESGHVTLSGQVISALDRETAEQTIRKLRGVVGVQPHGTRLDIKVPEARLDTFGRRNG